ncbi:MAG: hypothetical protein HY363_03620 [Candidatus Aenigmarchaeota archaeon]|nr:hypothetical protein [Candidatus Aenigmarchaeota archaeon]
MRDFKEIFRKMVQYFGWMRYEQLVENAPLSITCTPYVVRKSRQEGEKDLINLARSENIIGLWNFVPADSKWYHVSLEASLFEVENSLCSFEVKERSDEKLYKKDVIEYCTQPKKICESLQTLLNQCDADTIANTYLCFPTQWVIDHLAFSMQKHPLINVFAGVASPSGITHIELTDTSLATLEDYKDFSRALLGSCKTLQKFNGLPIQDVINTLFDVFNGAFQGKIRLRFSG